MIKFIVILFLVTGHQLNAQSWRSNYLPLESNNHITFESKTIDDTIWLSREDTLAFRPESKQYHFNFTVDSGKGIRFLISQRIGGADPDYNCSFPRQVLSKGDSGQVSICFPGRKMGPPFVLTRKYIVNTNTSKRDTLVVKRHFKWYDLNTTRANLKLGDSSLNIVEHTVNSKPQMMFLNLHENESTSIEALKIIADSIPIDYIYLEHGGERRVGFSNEEKQYSIDPNRIYTETGRKATLDENDQLDEFSLQTSLNLAEQICSKFRKGKAIISVHNNTEDEYSILSYLPDGGEAQNTGLLFINDAADPDDFIYTTDSLVYEAAKRDCINVILQSEDNFVDDGSLSVYCELNNIQYVNVETEHGHLTEQIRLILWVRSELITTNY